MEVRRDQVVHALHVKLGGQCDSSGHLNFKIYADGKFIGKPSISHSWKSLNDGRLSKVARQIFVSPRNLFDMAKCTKGADWFLAEMRRQRVI